MVTVLVGYRIDRKIYESPASVVYRAHHPEHGTPVILKRLKEDYPTPEEQTRYRQEYEITRALQAPGIIAAYDQLPVGGTLVMVLEDFGGTSLRLLTDGRPLPLSQFLDYAVKITEALDAVHSSQVIHKDLNPGNIVVNTEDGRVKLIDFGIATRLTRENRAPTGAARMQGTPAYMSPEQTGRMNCALDYRTDFYSLGATFYALLTGRKPFADIEDPAALVHAHLVSEPPACHEVHPAVPPTLSAIVTRLMAKRPEARYQSAWGIRHDLVTCRDAFAQTGTIPHLEPGGHDRRERFEIPQKLYGREPEIARLVRAFEDVADGPAAMLLVAGYSGIGKTALVQELYKPITGRRGFFISGKYDQFQRDMPYFAVAAAFRELVRQLLTEGEAALARRRDDLLDALGGNAQLIVDIIPELSLIIGSRPPAPEMGPVESQNRFNLTFRKFLKTFCRPEHPVVVFLDDLQWADAASLKLLQYLMTDEDLAHLLLIGAYRDNEVDAVHPLTLTLADMQAEGARVSRLTVGPLLRDHLAELIADTLDITHGEALEPARQTLEKTQGNPFFAAQFLNTLHREGLIGMRTDAGAHTRFWHTDRIAAMAMTDNVVDLVIGKLRKLTQPTQKALRLAACLGNRFDLDSLPTIGEWTPHAAFAALTEAVDEGFVQAVGELETRIDADGDAHLVIRRFKFMHDRVQQAAYALIDNAEKAAVHLRIGRLLLQSLDTQARADRILELMGHLNNGLDLVTDPAELHRLAQLNLAAGKKTMAGTAYDAALHYLTHGMDLMRRVVAADAPEGAAEDGLTERCWAHDYPTMRDLTVERARAAYLNGRFDASMALYRQATDHVRTPLEKAHIFRLKIVQLGTSADYTRAIEEGRSGIAMLGGSLPDTGLDAVLADEMARAETLLGSRTVGDLVDAPAMTDPVRIAELQLLNENIANAYILDQTLFGLHTLKIVNLSLEYGAVPESCCSFGCYGIILGPGAGRYDEAEQWGRLALNLCDRFDDAAQTCQALCMYASYLAHWKNPLRASIAIYDRSYRAGLECGHLLWSGYSANYKIHYALHFGKPLKTLLEDVPDARKFLRKLNNPMANEILWGLELAIRNMAGRTEDPATFSAPGMTEAQLTADCEAHSSPFAIGVFLVFKAQAQYIAGDPRACLESCRAVDAYSPYMLGTFTLAVRGFFQALALLQGDEGALSAEARGEIDDLTAQMRVYASHCPENFQHYLLLLEAECARHDGLHEQAMDGYDAAMAAAEAEGFIQIMALAAEAAGMYWLRRGKERFAAGYLRDAHQAWRNWQADRKAAALADRFPRFISMNSGRAIAMDDTTTGGGSTQTLDLQAVIDTTRKIREETDLGRLLTYIMETALEVAGAQQGSLLLHRERELVLKAIGSAGAPPTLLSARPERHHPLNLAVVQYVARTAQPVVLHDAGAEGLFAADADICERGVRSVLCFPILHQGLLIGIVYMENNKIAAAFDDRRREVLELIMAPAALSIENALLRQTQSAEAFTYQVGGSLPPEYPGYVTRDADSSLHAYLRGGEFCFVLDARQMGKSSLRVRAMHRLEAEQIRCTCLDLTLLGSAHTTPAQWYAGIARALVNGLGLRNELNIRTWWRAHEDLAPPQCLGTLIEDELLPRIPGKIVVFIDEVDSVLGLPFPRDDFFALIRAFYNRRADVPDFKRLSFVLLGVARPTDLIADFRRTPFNIGRSVTLRGFLLQEARPLLSGLTETSDNPAAVLQAVLDWTSGQPFLTQRVCRLLRDQETRPEPGKEASWVGAQVTRHVVDNWESQDDPEHLRTINNRILGSSEDPRSLLALYRDIIDGGAAAREDGPLHQVLALTGLIRRHNGAWIVGNQIYQRIFHRDWIVQTLADLP